MHSRLWNVGATRNIDKEQPGRKKVWDQMQPWKYKCKLTQQCN